MELKWNRLRSDTLPEVGTQVLICYRGREKNQATFHVCDVIRSQMGDIMLVYWKYDGEMFIYPETANKSGCMRMRWAYIPEPEE